MLRVGVTGGIGSGKSTVCRVFRVLGIPVCIADDIARQLMEEDPTLKAAIITTFGAGAYEDGRLNRPFLSAVFGDATKKEALDNLVHPATAAWTTAWFSKQSGAYAIKESALFLEAGLAHTVDVLVGMSAPEDTRIQRVSARSPLTDKAIRERMMAQMDAEEKMQRCDYVIINDGQNALLPQVLALHRIFSTGSASLKQQHF